MSDVCSSCPHAVIDHDATGCITCTCGAVYTAADPEPPLSTGADENAPERDSGTTTPETETDSGITVPEADPSE